MESIPEGRVFFSEEKKQETFIFSAAPTYPATGQDVILK
jgi:hypothetical protein